MKTKKLYCYVDETGQDVGTDYFVVVSIVSKSEQEPIRKELVEIESKSKVGARKWHKSRDNVKLSYLRLVTQEDLKETITFYGRYQKPLPFFLPMLETLSKAINESAEKPYKAVIYVDGIDKKKASELTNALHLKGINCDRVRSVRDEAEPMIRLADRWAGCIRDADENSESEAVVKKAEKSKKLKLV
jgi:hypothetical protein